MEHTSVSYCDWSNGFGKGVQMCGIGRRIPGENLPYCIIIFLWGETMSELLPLMDMLFIPQMIYEYGE
jgi:hypothetical protein